MKIVGVLIILNSIILCGWIFSEYGGSKYLVLLCLISIFSGLALTFQDRITELSIKGVGSLKAATVEAEAELSEIKSIKKRIEMQSATIDLVAKDAAESRELVRQIEESSAEVELQLESIQLLAQNAKTKSEELERGLQLNQTIIEAQDGDRVAFDKLARISKNDSEYSAAANQAYRRVLIQYSKSEIHQYKVFWPDGFDHLIFSFSDLKERFHMISHPFRESYIEYVYRRTDIPIRDRMDFLINVMSSDRSLSVVMHAGRLFSEPKHIRELGHPLLVDHYIEWWRFHRDKDWWEDKDRPTVSGE